jgi:hypothetical protein
MDSPAPSPTKAKIDIANTIDTAVGIAVPTDTDTNAKIDIANTIDTTVGITVLTDIDTNAKIDITNTIDTAVGIAVLTDTNAKINIDTIIDTTIDTIAGIAVPAIIDANPLEPEVDIVELIIIDTASLNATDLILAATIIGPTSGTTGAVSAITGGFDMAFGLFNFHVDNNGVAELISVGDSTPPANGPKHTTSYRGQSLGDRTAGAARGGTKAERFDPISRVK